MKNMYFLNETTANRYFMQNGVFLKNNVFKLDNKVIKKIDIEKSKSILYHAKFSPDMFLQFKNIDIKGFSFTKGLVYTGLNNVYGVINKYIDGESLEKKSLSSYNIDDVIRAIDEIKNSIKKLSDLNITVNDIRNSNIIFDGTNITLIDTTEYYYVYDNSHLYEANIVAVMETIFNDLFFSFYKNGFCDIYNIYRLLDICKIKLGDLRGKELLMNPVETLWMLKSYLEEQLEMELNTFGDSHKFMGDIVRGKTRIRRK